ncbi:MAG: GlsB/YeaQ/YmgE family stress response membrane protein [Cyanobacteria bacterium]|nr:GlsB/YeaQ/YmgE family stress response membrane protein [Cyanobacteria bacterium GSL.Bin21]
MLNIIAWLILGLVAGIIAKAIYPGDQGGGIIATILLGLLGAFIGGTLHTFLTTGAFSLTATTLSLSGLIVAVIGAIIAIFVWGLITRRG